MASRCYRENSQGAWLEEGDAILDTVKAYAGQLRKIVDTTYGVERAWFKLCLDEVEQGRIAWDSDRETHYIDEYACVRATNAFARLISQSEYDQWDYMNSDEWWNDQVDCYGIEYLAEIVSTP